MFKKVLRLKKAFDKKILLLLKSHRSLVVKLTTFNLMSALFSVSTIVLTKWLVDAASGGQGNMVLLFGSLFVGAMLCDVLFASVFTYQSSLDTEKLKNKLQYDLLATSLGKAWLSIRQYTLGDLLTRLQSDTNMVVTTVVSVVPSLIAFSVKLVLAFMLLAYYDWQLAVISLVIVPLSIGASYVIGFKAKRIQGSIQKAESIKTAYFNESLVNVLVVKVYQYSHVVLKQVATLQNQYFKAVKQKSKLTLQSGLFLNFGYRLGFLLAVLIGGLRLSGSAISFGTFTAFLQLVGLIQAPIHGIVHALPKLVATGAALDRLEEIKMLKDEDTEGQVFTDFDELMIKDLIFGYKANQPLFKGASLNLKKGQRLGIMGGSGIGKTTFLHLLLGLLQAQEGTLNLIKAGQTYALGVITRNLFAYVPQSENLFYGSLKMNILMGQDEDPQALDRALTTSGVSQFVNDLDQGLDTLVGERGLGLSQGQNQRVLIARALYSKAPILLFDEATSALDQATEYDLINKLASNYPNRTLIAVSHRMSIFDICDTVYQVNHQQFDQVSLQTTLKSNEELS